MTFADDDFEPQILAPDHPDSDELLEWATSGEMGLLDAEEVAKINLRKMVRSEAMATIHLL
jgi:hypothetical protein